jgi:hypothetical protein
MDRVAGFARWMEFREACVCEEQVLEEEAFIASLLQLGVPDPSLLGSGEGLAITGGANDGRETVCRLAVGSRAA